MKFLEIYDEIYPISTAYMAYFPIETFINFMLKSIIVNLVSIRSY